MIANYHTHTTRCNHAAGTEEEYIETAIAHGYEVLGFSDHAPMPFPGSYKSSFRMEVDEYAEYYQTLSGLKEKYKHKIRILIGLEAEYYPAVFPDFLKLISSFPPEYLILGQHFPGNEEGELYAARPTENPDNLLRYTSQVIEAMETGYFTYAAHPDIINFTGDEALYEECMRRICVRAKELSIPLEINFLGIGAQRNYPDDRFWRIAGETGGPVIFGCDAHRPDMVYKPEVEAQALALMERCGVCRDCLVTRLDL